MRHGVREDLRKCLSYSCKLLLKRVLAVSPAFVSHLAYKNAIQFGNTSGEEELLLGKVEAWSCMRLQNVLDALRCNSVVQEETQGQNVSKYARSVSDGFLCALEACLVSFEMP